VNEATDKALDLIYGRWRSQILYAGVELGIFDHVASEIAKPSETVAAELGVDPALLYRLMRALGARGERGLRTSMPDCFLPRDGRILAPGIHASGQLESSREARRRAKVVQRRTNSRLGLNGRVRRLLPEREFSTGSP
jgi:hypothetical protein